MDAKLSLVKDAEAGDVEEDQEPRSFADTLPGLAIVGAYVVVGLALFLVLNIVAWLLFQLHALGLPWWVLLVIYSGPGGALYRLLRERKRASQALTLRWASYRAWATDDLPRLWEQLLAFGRKAGALGRTVRGWVWAADQSTSKETAS